jgi:VanZ family protein
MANFFKKYLLVPACKIAMELTKPATKIVMTEEENSETRLQKLENKFLQLPVNQKVTVISVFATAIYLGGLGLLSYLWYRKQRRSSFHFFNDNPEWQQMDKFGHAYSAFQLSNLAFTTLQYAGLDRKTALKYGGWAGAVMMTPIEILDGFSDGYGASWGDEVANILGSAFFIWQQKKWEKIKYQPQFFFNPSPFAALRPELLGKNLSEQWLKDYNGQIYWLRFNESITDWGYFMVGYGAGNMIYGRPEQNIAAGYQPYREFYVGFELNTEKLLQQFSQTNIIAINTKPISYTQKIVQKFLKLRNLLGLPTLWWKIRI